MINPHIPPDQPLVEPLTTRELQILSHLAENRSDPEIADALVLSLNTVKWYNRQIYSKLGVNNRRQAVSRARQLGLLETGVPVSLPQHNLPAQLTPFVGRHEEVARICELMSEPTYRLLTLVGPGGTGKTRLAIEAASLLEAHQDSFRDGVYFVPLVAVSESESIIAALAQAIGFSFYQGEESMEQQLNQYLHQKRMLLVLDNFEHLIDDESRHLLTNILAAAPGIRMIITARARLNMRGEHLLPLGGMNIPEIESIAQWQHPLERAQAYSGIQLFLNSSRRLKPDFELYLENLMPIADICQSVQGMPLGIELAAGWVTILDPDEIADNIRQNLDFLETAESDVPERQRSMRTVCDSSWRLLTEQERLAFQRLSIFRGGFDRDGAEHAGGIMLETLLALINKCWLQREASGRFQIHELLRQYGAEKLARDAVLEAAVRDQHSKYYCNWLGQQEENIRGLKRQPEWDAIQDDIENVRAACTWAAAQGRSSQLEQAVEALGWYYYQGYDNYQQGASTFRRLRDTLVAAETWPSSATASQQRTVARALVWESAMWSMMSDQETSNRLIRESLALLERPALAGEDTKLERAHIARQYGCQRVGVDPRSSRQYFAQCLELYREIGHNLGTAYTLQDLGLAATYMRAYGEAREALTQSISLHRALGNQIGQCHAMRRLSEVAASQLRYQEAEDLIQQSLSLTPETNRLGIAEGLSVLGQFQILTGQYAEVEATLSRTDAIFEYLGLRAWGAIRRSLVLALTLLHRGMYGAARIHAEQAVSAAQELDWDLGIFYGKEVLAGLALAEADYDQTYRTMQKINIGMKESADKPFSFREACSSLASRGLGHRIEAWQHSVSAMEQAIKNQDLLNLVTALTSIALLLADEGENERATEVYALAAQHPHVANSQWFKDIAGREMAVIAASLPPQVAEAARTRAQASDLWQTAEELFESLRLRFGQDEQSGANSSE